jgi:hypothetical protein
MLGKALRAIRQEVIRDSGRIQRGEKVSPFSRRPR